MGRDLGNSPRFDRTIGWSRFAGTDARNKVVGVFVDQGNTSPVGFRTDVARSLHRKDVCSHYFREQYHGISSTIELMNNSGLLL
jgi:hypothetical protein